MTGPSSAFKRTLLLLLGGFLAAVAAGLLWTTFMVYDDEGYVLYSLRAFSEHGHLYDEIFSQYGPFFHVFYRGLHALGFAFTNTTGRIATLVCWLGAAGFCGAIVWRETNRNLVATAATVTGVFIHLRAMLAEPSHPGGFISLLVAGAAWIGMSSSRPSGLRAAAVGMIGAMLLLTKVNTGAFLIISLVTWWALQAYSCTIYRRWTVGLAIAAMPSLVMVKLLPTPWVATYACVVAAGALSLVVATRGIPIGPMRSGEIVVAALAALLVVVFTSAVVLLTGTSLGGLLDGALIGPLRLPQVYSLLFQWRTGALVVAGLAVPTAWWLARLQFKDRVAIVLPARVLLVGFFAGCALQLLPMPPASFVLSYGIATAWLFVLPIRTDDQTFTVRLWIALLLAMQALHGYPVAGSQVGWGTFLWVPLAALGIADLGVLVSSRGIRWLSTGLVGVAIAFGCELYAATAWSQLQESNRLGLPGAEQIRPPPATSSALRLLAKNSQYHADVLFTLPGMLSFNAWTGLPAPTITNATHWFNLLSASQQNAIQQKLAGSPRSAVIVQRNVYNYLRQEHVITPNPLLRYLLAEYVPLFTVDSYEFWVRKGRTVVPIDVAQCFISETGKPTRYRFNIVIDAPQRTEISTIELNRFVGNRIQKLGTWSDTNSAFIVSQIRSDGTLKGPSERRMLPFTVEGLVRIEVYTESFVPSALHSGVISLRDARGQKTFEARFID